MDPTAAVAAAGSASAIFASVVLQPPPRSALACAPEALAGPLGRLVRPGHARPERGPSTRLSGCRGPDRRGSGGRETGRSGHEDSARREPPCAGLVETGVDTARVGEEEEDDDAQTQRYTPPASPANRARRSRM